MLSKIVLLHYKLAVFPHHFTEWDLWIGSRKEFRFVTSSLHISWGNMVGRCLQVESDVLKLKLRLIVVVGITGMTVTSAVIVI
jgi:hypothetical protein